MDYAELLRSRRMVRHFTDAPVSDDAVERIVAAGLRAPSAGYSQGCSLLVLRTEDERHRLWATHSGSERRWSASVRAGLQKAPVVIVVLTSKRVYLDRYAAQDKGWTDRSESRWPVPYWYVDAGCVAMLILLSAINEGLGALLFGMAAGDIVTFRESFGVPDDIEFVGCIAVGHRDPNAPRRDLRSGQRPIEDLVHLGRW
ncbi:MAG: nitroreductase family protein [Acidimicrobiales bacterium]